MQHQRAGLILSIAALAALLNSSIAMACASCGCSLTTDWQNLEYTYKPGFKFDLRYDYLNQDQLRSGSSKISSAAASQVVNNGNPQEVEKFTRNNYVTLAVDYSKTADWGINVQTPYIIRSHSTLGTASDGFTPGADGGQYDSKTSALGDVKIIGRYQGFIRNQNLGLLLGMKLPTGSFNKTGNSTDSGAPGLVMIDRGLQPGTGTTDAIAGLYYNNAITPDWGYFATAMYQFALNSRNGYKPGNSINASAGIRYSGFDIIAPQLQFNLRELKHDRGNNADTVSTGGTLLYISPGIIAAVSDAVSLYGFVQLPLYQDVNGVQLAPRIISSVGLRYSF
ncbi:MAG: TonB-dependent receptor [Geobacteraceae bacterium]|nr:TonB-dependent receptor [Geobacteraceae bacterium]